MSGRLRTRSRRSMGPRPKTLRTRELLRQLERDAEPLFDHMLPLPPRPTTRGECVDGPRPCPWVSCKYHLYLDVKESGHIRLNFPDKEPDELEHSCSLDVVDNEHLTLEVVGDRVNLTRERVRLIQDEALEKLKARARGMKDEDDD